MLWGLQEWQALALRGFDGKKYSIASDVRMWHGRIARGMMRTTKIEVWRAMRTAAVRMRARLPALARRATCSQVTPLPVLHFG